MNFKFGKSTISVTSEGCYRCGTLWNSGWYPFKEIPIKIGDKTGTVTLHICNYCASKHDRTTSQMPLG